MKPEKQFETKVKNYLKACNCWFLKTWSNGVQREGIPDLLLCCNGYFIGVELKADNGTPTKLQEWNVEKIRHAGGIAIVLYPDQFDYFKGMIQQIQKYDSKVNHQMQYHFDKNF